ncbi:MAG: HPF/RaiA family ribosome-associated protein [Patescibacteria group bacterium]
MNLSISHHGFDLTQDVKLLVEKKFVRLEKHAVPILGVHADIDRDQHHRQGDIFHLRATIEVPHETFHGDAQGESIEAVLDRLIDQADHQISHYREIQKERGRPKAQIRRVMKSIFPWLGKEDC